MLPGQSSIPCGRGSVLVADDEPAIRTILREVLTRADFEVDLAEDGHDALEVMRKKRYDVVLIDLRMPRVNGLELLRAIRATWPKVPVIVASGGASSRDLATARDEGAFACLTKPFKLHQIIQEVGRAAESAAAPA